MIVFADRDDDGGITLSMRDLRLGGGSEEGAKAVRFMESLDRPARTGTIDGDVTVWAAGLDENQRVSVEGAAVIADGNRIRVTATTDKHGAYELTGLSPGRYRYGSRCRRGSHQPTPTGPNQPVKSSAQAPPTRLAAWRSSTSHVYEPAY